MWDELNRKKSAELCSSLIENAENKANSKTICGILMKNCLDEAAKRNGISRVFLGQVEPGERKRRLIDDITIVTIDL